MELEGSETFVHIQSKKGPHVRESISAVIVVIIGHSSSNMAGL